MLQLQFNRVQFTPDLMPGDILGSHILQESQNGRIMKFEPGAIFCNFLLADEINRASPKTQSALLEAMQEGAVTLLGQNRKLPVPFFVMASQNPIEQEGTYPLPEAQLDRFLFKLQVLNTPAGVLEDIITGRRRGEIPQDDFQVSPSQLEEIFAAMERIFLPRAVARYIARLTEATHPEAAEASEQVKKYVSFGASPRAAIAMAEASRGHAMLSGRPTVGFEDVRAVAPAVLNHRVLLNYNARFDKVNSYGVIDSLLTSMDEAGLDLPGEVSLK
ncbi:MAG: AAA family ATPase, partial [Sedimentisphaerales bacterium]|nr:AAA family ATPase [Sedimentisphaerales bacterium]